MVHTCFWDKMCGIVGFNWDDKTLVRKMAKTLEHRGPDQEGYYNDKHISLGHRRLSIIDLSEKGRQPMHNENRDIWITYNGEVYNFMEIREELEKRGHRFRSETDTEVIIHAYEEFGEKCLNKFNGMFAFAIWDSKNKKLFCARDRLGIKPFYYYWDGNKFIFASEIKAILEDKIKRVIDKIGLSYFLAYGYNTTNHTLFKNIFKLMPGHNLILQNNVVNIKRYWQIDFSKKINASESFFINKIRGYLESSVKSRLIADVPVGAFLSGGLDSSSIVAMASRHIENMKTFSVSFSEDGFDESKYAKLVSKEFNTDHYTLDFKAEDILKYFNLTLGYFDEPIVDTAIIPHYLVSKLARNHVKLVLTGEGGDESFAGYERYIVYKKLSLQKYIPSIINKLLLKPISYIPISANLINKFKIFVDYNNLKDYEMFSKTWSNVGICKGSKIVEKKDVLYDVSQSYKPNFKYKSVIDNVLNSDIHTYLQSNLLNLTDITSMANSLEARVPFLDHKFMEFSAKIPPNLKLKGSQTKYILKKSLKGILPDEIIHREKKGFNTPLENYFKNQLRSFVHDALSSKEFKNIGLFNQKKVLNIIEKHNSGRGNYRQTIFTLLVFQKWVKQWKPSLDF